MVEIFRDAVCALFKSHCVCQSRLASTQRPWYHSYHSVGNGPLIIHANTSLLDKPASLVHIIRYALTAQPLKQTKRQAIYSATSKTKPLPIQSQSNQTAANQIRKSVTCPEVLQQQLLALPSQLSQLLGPRTNSSEHVHCKLPTPNSRLAS